MKSFYESLSEEGKERALEIGLMAMMAAAQPTPPSQSSARIGAAGEDSIASILETRYKVINVSKIAQSCDLLAVHKGKRVLVEIKNYSTVVGGQQVDKFMRDVGINSAAGGILISLNTPIRGISGCIHVCNELIDNRLFPIVYIVGSDIDMIIDAVALVADLSNVNAERNEAQTETVRRHLDGAIESLERVSHSRHSISTYVSEVLSGVHKHIANMIVAESSMREYVIGLRDNLYNYECTAGECPIDPSGIDSGTYELITDITKGISGEWKRTKNKYTSEHGFGFIIERKCVRFYIERSLVSMEKLVSGIDLGADVTNLLSVQVRSDTIDYIKALIIC